MKRTIKKIKQNLVGFILGAIIFSIIGVYAATQIASSNVTYTNNNQENVQGAIDDLYNKTKDYAKVEKCSGDNCKKCKRATMLHTEKCDTSNCQSAGYAEGEPIIYGNLGTAGTLASGDAFDCDVNGDGYYDPTTERFYYISEYYNTSTKQFESDTAVLIYYVNVSNGIANNTDLVRYSYNHEGGINKNYKGPISLLSQLPKTNQWNNVRLKNISRVILSNKNNNTTDNGNQKLPGSDEEHPKFSYEGCAARLLTYQEINDSCIVGTGETGELDTCQYLMENTKFGKNISAYSYWLETPFYINSIDVNIITSLGRRIFATPITSDYIVLNGVRPVIEVSISDIEY